MPFDVAEPTVHTLARGNRPVAIWLLIMCAMILVMVTLGGATRLTGSGLSIMEWAPIMGALPPLSDAEWHRLYTLYQQIPQYDLVNKGFGLDGFKGIFWLEWTHRAWGRLMGVAFVVPLVWFAVRGQIGPRLGVRLAALFVLGGLQGGVGWLMVASGFEADSTAVSPYRLVTHLTLAVLLYAAILWTALSLLPRDRQPGDRVTARWAGLVCALVALTMAAGGFVAGLRAGLTYNSFPLMDGRLVPDGYASLEPFVRNWFENVAAVQFNHRLLATLAAIVGLATVFVGLRRAKGSVARGRAASALGIAIILQYALGVLTLLWVVPVSLGTAHQSMAMLVLTAALVLLRVSRAPARVYRPKEA